MELVDLTDFASRSNPFVRKFSNVHKSRADTMVNIYIVSRRLATYDHIEITICTIHTSKFGCEGPRQIGSTLRPAVDFAERTFKKSGLRPEVAMAITVHTPTLGRRIGQAFTGVDRNYELQLRASKLEQYLTTQDAITKIIARAAT